MTDLQAKAEAAAESLRDRARFFLAARANEDWSLDWLIANAMAHALQFEGWRPISECSSRVKIGATSGVGLDADKLVWFRDGYPTHFKPLPAPPEGEG